MAKPVRSTMKWMFSPLTQVKTWFGLSFLKAGASRLKKNIDTALPEKKTKRKESFEQAIKRLKLDNKAITDLEKRFLQMMLMMLFFAFLPLIYGIYLFFVTNALAASLAILVSSILFAYAFRFHFWYFQIKRRKLGCSVADWLNAKASTEEK